MGGGEGSRRIKYIIVHSVFSFAAAGGDEMENFRETVSSAQVSYYAADELSNRDLFVDTAEPESERNESVLLSDGNQVTKADIVVDFYTNSAEHSIDSKDETLNTAKEVSGLCISRTCGI